MADEEDKGSRGKAVRRGCLIIMAFTVFSWFAIYGIVKFIGAMINGNGL